MSAVSDSDDDLPIADFIRKRKLQASGVGTSNGSSSNSSSSKVAEKSKKNNGDSRPAETTKKVKAEPTTREKSSTRERDIAPEKKQSSSAAGASLSAQFYEDTNKGRIVQKLLCRWWYAIDWPTAEDIGSCPDGYEPLDGFQGVFISTRVDNLGDIVDLRNKETCPNLINLSQKPTSELKQLCLDAYDKQLDALREREGEDCKLYSALRLERREIKAIDADKADREARKYSFSVPSK